MDEELTPLGELLEAARKRQRPARSQNAVAKEAGTSGTTYRRIIRGVSRFGGQDVPFGGSPETVAHLAQTLGVTTQQLTQVGRADAAKELDALLAEQRDDADPAASQPLDDLPTDVDERIQELERRQAEIAERLAEDARANAALAAEIARLREGRSRAAG